MSGGVQVVMPAEGEAQKLPLPLLRLNCQEPGIPKNHFEPVPRPVGKTIYSTRSKLRGTDKALYWEHIQGSVPMPFLSPSAESMVITKNWYWQQATIIGGTYCMHCMQNADIKSVAWLRASAYLR